MKRILGFAAFLMLFTLNAQSGFGVKGGLTYNADDGLIKTANSTYQANGEGSAGYHLGVYKRFGLSGLYIQPLSLIHI